MFSLPYFIPFHAFVHFRSVHLWLRTFLPSRDFLKLLSVRSIFNASPEARPGWMPFCSEPEEPYWHQSQVCFLLSLSVLTTSTNIFWVSSVSWVSFAYQFRCIASSSDSPSGPMSCKLSTLTIVTATRMANSLQLQLTAPPNITSSHVDSHILDIPSCGHAIHEKNTRGIKTSMWQLWRVWLQKVKRRRQIWNKKKVWLSYNSSQLVIWKIWNPGFSSSPPVVSVVLDCPDVPLRRSAAPVSWAKAVQSLL